MRDVFIKLVAGLCITVAASSSALADTDIGLSVDDGGIKSFYLAIGDHYGVPQNNIVAVKKRSLSDEELAVVFFLAARAKIGSNVIVDLRLGGKTWMEIALKIGIQADVFYVPLTRKPGPPYGKAYGHFKNKKRNKWQEIDLTDADIINFVNLRFISEHYGYSADDVVAFREKGLSFVKINSEVKNKAKKQNDQSLRSDFDKDEKPDKSKGKKNK